MIGIVILLIVAVMVIIGVVIGLFITWIGQPELTGMQLMLKYLNWYIIKWIAVLIIYITNLWLKQE